MTVRAFVSGRSTSITFGHMTSSIIDEFSRECLAIRVKRRLNSTDVIAALTDLFIVRGVPACSRSDNGLEFIAEAVRLWIIGRRREDRLYRARVTMGERLLRELQRPFQGQTLEWGDILYPGRRLNRNRAVATAYDTKRPHSALGCRPPAPESVIPREEKRMMHEISNRTNDGGRSLP